MLEGERAEAEAWSQQHAAREVRAGVWRYTCRHGGRLEPIGDCSERCEHPTREDAERHYRAYLLGSARFDGEWPGKEHRCGVCGAWTHRYAVLETNLALPLCPAHLDRAGLEQLFLLQELAAGHN